MLFEGNFPVLENGEPEFPCLEKYTAPVKQAERQIVGREVEKGRLMAAMQRPELCNVILLAEAGSGKALANDTKIPVADERGYVNIGDLKIGDIVFDDKGNRTKVIGVYPQGKLYARKVSFGDGCSVVCNDEHLWQVQNYHEYYKGEESHTMSLDDLVNKGIRTTTRAKWYVPVSGAVDRPKMNYKLDPYIVGLMIGSKKTIDHLVFQLHISRKRKDAMEIASDILGAKKSLPPVDGTLFIFEITDENGRRSAFRQKTIEDMLGDSAELLVRCVPANRRIPDEYMKGSIEQRFSLLQGIMDSTGYVEDHANCGVGVRVPSIELATQIKSLINSLGMRCNMTESYLSGYSLKLLIPYEMKEGLFRNKHCKNKIALHKPRDGKANKRYSGIAIENVKDLHKKVPMTCIQVDSKSHLFLCTENYIVTHNTALVQGTMLEDTKRYYLEVDVPKIISEVDDTSKVANELKSLFDEVSAYCHKYKAEIVLFMDEFHQIVQASPAAVEALKPLLADSGTRGIRVIAATTFVEFRKWISPNQPLVERLQRINLEAPTKEMVVKILRDMAKKYEVDHQFPDNRLFEEIYDLTNRYIPANAQPRKSILVLDAMIGWYRAANRKIDRKLLADVIYESENVNVAFRVDATKIKSTLDEHVFAQQYATTAIQNRLQICVADLNDKSKPMSSFLFTGSTGTGKLCSDDTLVPIYLADNADTHFKRHGDLVPGDMVFDRTGKPTMILDTFKHKNVDMYRVTFADDRTLDVGADHLWGIFTAKQRIKMGKDLDMSRMQVVSTKQLFDAGVVNTRMQTGRTSPCVSMKYYVPMNGAVQWPEQNYKVDPYIVGSFIGNGCLRNTTLYFSSNDNFSINEIAKLLNAVPSDKSPQSYSRRFRLLPLRRKGKGYACYQTADLFKDMPEIYMKKSRDRRIPQQYMYGSIEQRWALVQGLFDTDGTILSNDRANVSYSTFSEQLAYDVQQLLYSLGVSSTINVSKRTKKEKNGSRNLVEYTVRVKSENSLKYRFFRTPKKLEIAKKAANLPRERSKKFNLLGIRNIEYIGKQDAQCILVDNEEHLYQAGQFIVTHNTEVTKQLAQILFNDQRRLIRFDMSEYANADSLDSFRKELTARVWERPYSIIMLDEIEKACAPVTKLLLQVLDDGRLTDENNREVSFVNAYIILTTNAGNEIYKHLSQYEQSDTGDGSALKEYQKAIRDSISQTSGDNKFPPELLGRIDCIVPFQPLSRDTQERILRSKYLKFANEVHSKHNIQLMFENREAEAKLYRFIIDDNLDTDSDSGGARRVVSKFEEEVVTKVSAAINASDSSVKALKISVEGDLAADNKHMRTSSAHVMVTKMIDSRGSRWM